jgi:hypothetical protein
MSPPLSSLLSVGISRRGSPDRFTEPARRARRRKDLYPTEGAG